MKRNLYIAVKFYTYVLAVRGSNGGHNPNHKSRRLIAQGYASWLAHSVYREWKHSWICALAARVQGLIRFQSFVHMPSPASWQFCNEATSEKDTAILPFKGKPRWQAAMTGVKLDPLTVQIFLLTSSLMSKPPQKLKEGRDAISAPHLSNHHTLAD